MRNPISISLLCAVLSQSGLVLAGETNTNHDAMAGQQAMTMQLHKAHGTVNNIDMQHSKVNLTHGPIKSLGWSGMTMDFAVKDAAILEHVTIGQKVDFELVNEGPGKYFVTRITPAI